MTILLFHLIFHTTAIKNPVKLSQSFLFVNAVASAPLLLLHTMIFINILSDEEYVWSLKHDTNSDAES